MVVVVIIGVVAALAIPAMSVGGFDRRAYSDAGSIMMLFRSARTRAVARGGAVLISMSASGTSDRGTFLMFEAVAPNVAGGGAARTPLATCKSPTLWQSLPTSANPLANPNVALIDGVNLNETGLETQADIETQLMQYPSPSNSGATTFTNGYLCYTPLGHTYFVPGIAPAAGNMFDGVLPTISPIEARVTRANGGTFRSVLVPPNGMARLFSHT
jgi:type II secretory pathway pseudopilin PulG